MTLICQSQTSRRICKRKFSSKVLLATYAFLAETRDHTSARALWLHLERIYIGADSEDVMQRVDKFYHFRFTVGDSMKDHLEKMMSMRDQLELHNQKPTDDVLIDRIMKTLSSGYNTLKTNWSYLSCEQRTLDELKERILRRRRTPTIGSRELHGLTPKGEKMNHLDPMMEKFHSADGEDDDNDPRPDSPDDTGVNVNIFDGTYTGTGYGADPTQLLDVERFKCDQFLNAVTATAHWKVKSVVSLLVEASLAAKYLGMDAEKSRLTLTMLGMSGDNRKFQDCYNDLAQSCVVAITRGNNIEKMTKKIVIQHYPSFNF